MSNPINMEAIRTIAAGLPGDWTVEQNHSWVATATRADGLALIFAAGYGYAPGKGYVKLVGPKDYMGVMHYDESLPEIGLTFGKKGAAKDVERRLLPEAEEMHARLVERLKDQGERKSQEEALLERLRATGAVSACVNQRDPQELSLKDTHGYGRVKVTGPSRVRIEISIDADVAVAVLEALR